MRKDRERRAVTGSRTFLIGGGWDGAAARFIYGPFLEAAGAEARIGCFAVDEGDGYEHFARYEAVLRTVGDCTAVPLLVPPGTSFDVGALDGIDGLLVCGGLTPAYLDALSSCLEELPRLLVGRGIPYAGFSAGAAVAARHAIVGGWLSDGVPVCPEDTAEDLVEIEVRAGLGLVPFAVDVHAAQWGTLPRLLTVVARADVAQGVAVDENTLVEMAEDGQHARVAGRGRAHSVQPSADGGVVVRSYRSGESFAIK
jgi:cyanophycinase